MLIPTGTAIGECGNCGVVVGDAVRYRFPNPSVCKECGDRLDETKITVKDTEVPADQVTGEV